MDYRFLSDAVDDIYAWIKCYRPAIKASLYARKRVKMINGGYRGSRKEFRQEVTRYWKKYGQNPKRYWYQIYCANQGSFDPRFIPDSIWYTKIQPYFNCTVFRSVYADKTMYDRYFAHLKQPETIIKNTAGHFYDGKGNWIPQDEAFKLLCESTEFIIKPSLRSGGGREVRYVGPEDITPEKMEQLMKHYNANFVVQKLVRQHPDLARIHPKSLNTIRVMSLHYKGKVHILSAQLRMGSGDARVDNVSSGGMACAIVDREGHLAEKSVTRKSQWTDHHPSGIAFRDIVVPSYDKVLSVVEQTHRVVPFFNIIGWDFAVDESGEPVFIEFNVGCEQNQIGSGKPTFGDLTDEILDDVFIKKTRAGLFR